MPLRHVLVISAVTILLFASHARGAVTGWTDVVVRVYDTSGVVAGTTSTPLVLARQTLSGASIDVTWRVCAQSAACDRPMRPGELAIRIVRSRVPLVYHGTMPLGNALIDAGAASGVLATIYLDRVLWLARRAHTDSHTLLGRAIAHELGHLLMATITHGPVGLMRAVWSEEEVRRGRSSDWMFAAQEINAIRRRLESRTLVLFDE